MNYDLYLKRIGAGRNLPLSFETLAFLQRQHMLQVPFENLDIWYRKPIALDVAAFYQKIVSERRGGYCYECNGLFHSLLLWMGFDSRMISCRVVTGRHIGAAYDHMALIVTLEGQEWLVDVGFGDFSAVPLKLEAGRVQQDGRMQYLIDHYGTPDQACYYRVSRFKQSKHKFLPIYLLDPAACALDDFREMHGWQQQSPDSHFTRQLICSRLTPTGRISLIGNRLINTCNGEKEEKLLYGTDALLQHLVQAFGMKAPGLRALFRSALVKA